MGRNAEAKSRPRGKHRVAQRDARRESVNESILCPRTVRAVIVFISRDRATLFQYCTVHYKHDSSLRQQGTRQACKNGFEQAIKPSAFSIHLVNEDEIGPTEGLSRL